MQPIVTAIRVCLIDKLFTSVGRAGRLEFWVFTIFSIAMRIGLYPIVQFQYMDHVYNIVSFILFVANFTVLARRLHDTGRTAAHLAPVLAGVAVIILGFFTMMQYIVYAGLGIALLGILYVLVLAALRGDQGLNRFGEPQPIVDSDDNNQQMPPL